MKLRVTVQLLGKEKRVFEVEVSERLSPWGVFKEVCSAIRSVLGHLEARRYGDGFVVRPKLGSHRARLRV